MQWNAVKSFTIALEQSVDSYNQQNTANMTNKKSIYSYLDISFNSGGLFVKYIGTHGSPGIGNSFVGQNPSLYVIYKGLRIISMSVIA